jgi:DNA processing protein
MVGMRHDMGGVPTFWRVPSGDAELPRRLADLSPAAPRQLWVEGRLPGPDELLLAIVGSRAASMKACAGISELASGLARAGFAVVSGGALGVDAAAHRGALAGRGATFAVLGCGIDVIYPDRHAGLFRDIAANGGLLSEYGPGVKPRPGQFPARNRLVAGLAHAVIVGECRSRSGALITARIAARLRRPLCAVPGSSGTDGLLAAGAAFPVSTAADVSAVLAGMPAGPAPAPGGPEGAALRRALGDEAVTADEIAARLGRGLGDVLGMLSEGELDGWILRRSGGRFEVHRGH